MREQRLAGKVVLVTGGASGIGAASAERLRQEGATVVVGDLNVHEADADALRLDVADPDSVGSAIAAIIGRPTAKAFWSLLGTMQPSQPGSMLTRCTSAEHRCSRNRSCGA